MSDRKVAKHREAPVRAPRRRSWLVTVLICTWRAIFADNISLLAAGVAFYSLLAIFPGLAFAVALFGLSANPEALQHELQSVHNVLPAEAWDALDKQLVALTSVSNATLSIASIVSALVALFSARLAASAMMGALNVVYKREETRSFLKTNLVALLFTLGAIAVLALNVIAVAGVPWVLRQLGLEGITNGAVGELRWPALAVIMAIALALTYRHAPNRPHARWQWLSIGSVIATVLWIGASFAFSWYVSSFGSYDKLYGAFGAFVILLYWFWLTAYVALLGAELDMQMHCAREGAP